jgi:hypothetical protein
MAGVPKLYKNHVAGGKGILIFSILFAVFMRFIFITSSGTTSIETEGGYLWQFCKQFSSNILYSLIGSSIIVGIMALSATHINTDFVLIRRRTLLPPAMIILLFSCHPSILWISPAYVGVLFLFLIVSILFSVYNNDFVKPVAAFKIAFILSAGSLFTPVLLLYIPISWLALIVMRCFNFKSVLASLLGLFVIYFPVFSFYLFTDNLNGFLTPFITSLNVQKLMQFPFLNMNVVSPFFLIVAIIPLSIAITSSYINRYKDKIRNRAYLSLLTLLTVLSLLFFLFLNITPEVNLYISVGMGSLLISHFFALTEKKGTAILFYICIVFCFLFSTFACWGIV